MRRTGFTLIELMVSLVVAGILMSGLVSLSGAVQRAFARNKDITELQGNLRFAMKMLSDDFARASNGSSPNPRWDSYVFPPKPSNDMPAISFVSADRSVHLIGNYSSSDDYTVQLFPSNPSIIQIVCRNKFVFSNSALCGHDVSIGKAYDRDFPFGIDPEASADNSSYTEYNRKMFELRFNPTFWIQIQSPDDPRRSYWSRITAVNATQMTMTIDPPINSAQFQGFFARITPISEIFYRVVPDPAYTPLYTTGTDDRLRYLLQRVSNVASTQTTQEVADFLLSPNIQAIGFELESYNDLNALTASDDVLNSGNTDPDFGPTSSPVKPIQVTTPLHLSERYTRAVVITLRGRTETEDPDFILSGNPVDTRNFAVDIDGQPENGMAHVRVVRSVVQIANLGRRLSF